MRQIVIAGASAYGLNNLSDDCMMQVLCRELRALYPGVRLVLLARHPSQALDDSFGVESIKNLDFDNREQSLGRWYRGLNPKDPTDHLARITAEIAKADLLVLSGAVFIDNISIAFMRGLIPYAAILVTLARFLGTPVTFNGLHIGRPLETDEGMTLTRYCLQHARSITLRDEASSPFVSDLGIDMSRVHVLADASYGLNPVHETGIVNRALSKAGLALHKKRMIGVTFRMLYWRWSAVERDHYTSIMAEACDRLVEEMGLDVVLVPHNTYGIDKTFMDDRPGHDLIAAKCRYANCIHPVRTRLTVDETLGLYTCFEAVFSNRRHSAIWAVIQGVPPVATGEKDHVKPPFCQLGLDSRLFLSMNELSSESIAASVQWASSHREQVLEIPRQQLALLRNKAVQNARYLEEQTE